MKSHPSARTEEKRARIAHRAGAVLYRIDATPDSASTGWATHAVMERAQAYREIKNQIHKRAAENDRGGCRGFSPIQICDEYVASSVTPAKLPI